MSFEILGKPWWQQLRDQAAHLAIAALLAHAAASPAWGEGVAVAVAILREQAQHGWRFWKDWHKGSVLDIAVFAIGGSWRFFA